MRSHPFDERQLAALLWSLTGFALLLSSAVAAEAARGHMAALGAICGSPLHAHCGWCFGAAALALAGLSAVARAASLSRRTAYARSVTR